MKCRCPPPPSPPRTHTYADAHNPTSQVRGGIFKKAKLLGASFFDATLDDSTFVGADMRQVNLEMASLVNADLRYDVR